MAVLAAAACGDDADQPAASDSPTADQTTSAEPAAPSLVASATDQANVPLTFTVIGSCTSAGGTLTAVGSGFTPNSTYSTEVWYPDGRPYVSIDNPGNADVSGATPDWQWPCALGESDGGDPPGTYKVTITDIATGRTVDTTFEVGEP